MMKKIVLILLAVCIFTPEEGVSAPQSEPNDPEPEVPAPESKTYDAGPAALPPHSDSKVPEPDLAPTNWAEIEEEMSKYHGRPLPPELADLMDDQHKDNDELQECMSEFVICLHAHKQNELYLCGVSSVTNEKKKFKTLCDLNYANCKEGEGTWHFIADDSCAFATEASSQPSIPK